MLNKALNNLFSDFENVFISRANKFNTFHGNVPFLEPLIRGHALVRTQISEKLKLLTPRFFDRK